MPPGDPDPNERTRASLPEDDSRSGEEFQKDQILGGRYRVLSVLGKGGMGVVYRVEQIFLSKEFALKTIDKRLMSDKTIRRFQHEARASFAVNHPNIISVNDFGLLDDETPFLAMEIVTGETLAARLKRCGALSVSEAVPIFAQICFALAHAHSQGVVHRDIKPSNIMLLENLSPTEEGSVKLLDFGIAKFTHSEASEVQELTKTGEVFGSPLYMSPEQCSGGKVDHRADVYSLGCVMFEAFTGTPPFAGENALATIIMHQTEPPPTLKEASLGGEFPPELERIIATMLAKNPDDRFQHLGKLAHNLALLVRGEPLKLSARAPVAKEEDKSKTITLTRPVFYGILIAVAAVAALITASVFHFLPVLKRSESHTTSQSKVSSAKNVESEYDELFAQGVKTGQCRFKSSYVGNDRSLSIFKGYKGAQCLEFSDCGVTDKGLANLQDSKVLKLKLESCEISSVENLCRLTYLQTLDLSRTAIDDRALLKLAKLPMLALLDLQHCKVSPKGLESLSSSRSLLCVILSKDLATPQVLATLKRKMPGCNFPPYQNNTKFQEFIANWKGASYFDAFQHCYLAAANIDPLSDSCGLYLSMMAEERAKQGKHADAIRIWKQERELFEKNGNLLRLAAAMHRGANICHVMGDTKQSIEFADKAKALYLETMIHDEERLLVTLDSMCGLARQANDNNRVVKYCEDALGLLDRFHPGRNEFRPIFLERAGWSYFLLSKKAEALKLIQRYLDYVENPANKADLRDVARANIEIAHCLSDPVLRKQHYNKGLRIIEQLNFPKSLNLRDHYCDACFSSAQICVATGDFQNASDYMARAISTATLVNSADIRLKVYREYANDISKHVQKKK